MKLHLKLFSLLVCLLCSMAVHAITEDDLMRLEAEMLNYISSSERDSFTTVSNRLKEAAKEAGNKRLFYKAWSKQAVFEAMRTFLAYEDISCVVIMTDGLAPFPPESVAMGVPVLWLLTKDVVTPPWGRVAHMEG